MSELAQGQVNGSNALTTKISFHEDIAKQIIYWKALDVTNNSMTFLLDRLIE